MRIFYDVDTQNDFMNKNGALYVPGAELIKPNLKLLTDYAEMNKVSIVGSLDVHFGTEEHKDKEGELQRWGGPFPDHCMYNSEGAMKISETRTFGSGQIILPNYLSHGTWSRLDTAVSESKRNSSVYFEKQSYDIFKTPFFERFLEKAGVKEAAVYGVATDYCIKAAVLGLQERGIQCYVVEDAIKGVAPETTESALEEMAKAGAKFVKAAEVTR